MSGFDNIIKLVSDDKEYKINKLIVQQFPESLLYKVIFNSQQSNLILSKDKIFYIDIDSTSLDYVVKLLRGYSYADIVNHCNDKYLPFVSHDLKRLGFQSTPETVITDLSNDNTNDKNDIENTDDIFRQLESTIKSDEICQSKARNLKGIISNSLTVLQF